MAGTVRATIDGRTYTATQNYHVVEHSGAPEDVLAYMPDFAKRALRKSRYTPEDMEGGDVTVVVDGQLVSKGMSKWPDTEVGSADQSGFGFGGLDATLDILNWGVTAQESFSIRRAGQGEYGGEWETYVDGELEVDGTTRPFQVTWENGGSGGWL
jgi:hypothetical protein